MVPAQIKRLFFIHNYQRLISTIKTQQPPPPPPFKKSTIMVPWFEPCSRPDGEPCDCCWTWNDFSLATDDEAMLQRRLSMWTILAVRTLMTILRIFYHLRSSSALLIIWDVVSGLADFSLAGLALSSISKVKGQRKVPILGTYMVRSKNNSICVQAVDFG